MLQGAFFKFRLCSAAVSVPLAATCTVPGAFPKDMAEVIDGSSVRLWGDSCGVQAGYFIRPGLPVHYHPQLGAASADGFRGYG